MVERIFFGTILTTTAFVTGLLTGAIGLAALMWGNVEDGEDPRDWFYKKDRKWED